MRNKVADISVVMSVKDDETEVATSIESILQQNDVEFEFVIVNDGSRDNTARILQEYEGKDRRITVVNREHQSLTKALILGCARANGKYIARQDGGGDISLPGRLRAQYRQLEGEERVVMVASAARFVGPEGEHLYDSVIAQQDFDRGIKSLRSHEVRCPSHHGNTMFRRAAYEAVGGYRAAFPVAQDLDLWLRMHEIGQIVVDETITYVAKLRPGGISFKHRARQTATTKLVLQAAKLRRSGESDYALLEAVLSRGKQTSPKGLEYKSTPNAGEAEGFYHIGACLNGRDKQRARHYYRMALRKNPTHWRAMVRWVATYLI